jgi:hypothetical protein
MCKVPFHCDARGGEGVKPIRLTMAPFACVGFRSFGGEPFGLKCAE